MINIKKEFVVEFTLLGKQLRTTLHAENKEDALEELFKSIRAKTKVHFVAEPEGGINDFISTFNDTVNRTDEDKRATFQ
ncbi:MAG: hypothetical protein ACKVT2_20250 [Saprospiraceae bacterium]